MSGNTPEQTILHVDMDAFFASVEQHDHPEYLGRPVVVGALPGQRGVVSAASYEARRYGIHSAMPISEAYRRCPSAVYVPVNMKRYQTVSRQIFSIFERFTPLIEPLSCDEAFLDVGGALHLFGPPQDIARRIKQTVKEESGLTASIGVAHNKFLAKLASDLEKPDGLTIVPRDDTAVEAFLAPLAVRRIWGVGKVLGETLHANGIRTIGDLQGWEMASLERLIGSRAARHLYELARGRDERGLTLTHEEKSISREYTFSTDCSDPDEIYAVVRDLCGDVGRRLRKKKLFTTGVQVKVRWTGFTTQTRQMQSSEAFNDDFTLYEYARRLLEKVEFSKAVRLVGVGANRLSASRCQQLDLFDSGSQSALKKQKLSETMDKIRIDYGPDSISLG
jgi:DNA polymerase-4